MVPGFTWEKAEHFFSPAATLPWSQSPVQTTSKQAWQLFTPLPFLRRCCRHTVKPATQLCTLLLDRRCYTTIKCIDLFVRAEGSHQHLVTKWRWCTKCIFCLCLCVFFFFTVFFFKERIYFSWEIFISESHRVVICSQRYILNPFLWALIHTRLNS